MTGRGAPKAAPFSAAPGRYGKPNNQRKSAGKGFFRFLFLSCRDPSGQKKGERVIYSGDRAGFHPGPFPSPLQADVSGAMGTRRRPYLSPMNIIMSPGGKVNTEIARRAGGNVSAAGLWERRRR